MNRNEKEKLLEQYDFNLKDFALFLSVMKDKRAYKNVLEIIMNRENIVLKDIKILSRNVRCSDFEVWQENKI